MNDDDNRFPDNSPVEIRYPGSKHEEHGDRAAWPVGRHGCRWIAERANGLTLGCTP